MYILITLLCIPETVTLFNSTGVYFHEKFSLEKNCEFHSDMECLKNCVQPVKEVCPVATTGPLVQPASTTGPLVPSSKYQITIPSLKYKQITAKPRIVEIKEICLISTMEPRASSFKYQIIIPGLKYQQITGKPRIIETNSFVTSMANTIMSKDVAVQCEPPILKDISTQIHDEIYEQIMINFYWKLKYLANDKLALDTLQYILNVAPKNPIALADTLIKSVNINFEYGT